MYHLPPRPTSSRSLLVNRPHAPLVTTMVNQEAQHIDIPTNYLQNIFWYSHHSGVLPKISTETLIVTLRISTVED